MTIPSLKPSVSQRHRNRGLLLVIVVLFFGSAGLAGILRFSGWTPPINRHHGELLQPPIDLRAAPLHDSNGATWNWNPSARQWHILIVPAPNNSADERLLLQALTTLWQTLGHRADRVTMLWLGRTPAVANIPALPLHILPDSAEVRAALGEPPDLSIYIVDPHGFVILYYAADSDPAGLRSDMVKLLKLR